MSHKTGNTFRIILTALGSASVGRRVVVVCFSTDEVVHVMKATVKMAKTYLTPDFLTHALLNKYLMANGGTLTFLTTREFEEQVGDMKVDTHIIHVNL